MQPFAFLTTQGRARRLRSLAFNALDAYDLDVTRLRLVSNETNCTFRVDTIEAETFALRISLPDIHSREEIEAEVAWLLAIDGETDLTVPSPVASRSGEFVVTACGQGVPEARHCVLFTWMPGRELEEIASPFLFQEFGALSAELHQHGAAYAPVEAAAIRSLDTLYPLGDEEKILDPSTADLFPARDYDLLLEMHAAAKRELDWLYASGRMPHIVHGDLHWWNVMSHRGSLQVIDFEDLCWAFPIQDIAITLYYAADHREFPTYRAAFKDGYEGRSPWPEVYPGQLELHMVHRAVDLFNFVLGSTYREHQDLLAGFVENIQTRHRTVFETWKAQFQEEFYR